MSHEQKLIFLNYLKESKDILFSQYSTSITKETKLKCWKDVNEKCLSIGYVLPPSKDWSYWRDTVWPNLRNATIRKRDLKRKTGASGGKENTLNEIDLAVLDIIGKDSDVVDGLNVKETWECGSSNASLSGINLDYDCYVIKPSNNNSSASTSSQITVTQCNENISKPSNSSQIFTPISKNACIILMPKLTRWMIRRKEK